MHTHAQFRRYIRMFDFHSWQLLVCPLLDENGWNVILFPIMAHIYSRILPKCLKIRYNTSHHIMQQGLAYPTMHGFTVVSRAMQTWDNMRAYPEIDSIGEVGGLETSFSAFVGWTGLSAFCGSVLECTQKHHTTASINPVLPQYGIPGAPHPFPSLISPMWSLGWFSHNLHKTWRTQYTMSNVQMPCRQ